MAVAFWVGGVDYSGLGRGDEGFPWRGDGAGERSVGGFWMFARQETLPNRHGASAASAGGVTGGCSRRLAGCPYTHALHIF
jgi:hypothetical protein